MMQEMIEKRRFLGKGFAGEVLMGGGKSPLPCSLMLFFLWFFYFGVSIRLCAQGTPADGYEEGMIYLKIKNGDAALHYNPQTHVVTPAVLAPIFAQFQVYALERPFLPLGVNFEKCYSIRHHAGQSAGLVSALAGFPFVEFVERVPHDEVDIDCADCPTMPANPEMNYYMNRVRACEAFDFYNSNNAPPTGGALTRVAVVDDAIMTDHEDITVAMGYDVIHNDNNPAPPFEMNLGNLSRFKHGTQVASIVAGNVNNNLGVSSLGWFNQLIAVKTQHDRVNHTPGTPPSAFYAGVAWAAANGAVQVINMSWGSNRPSQMNYNVIVEAWNRGIILVSTAGNIDGLPNPSTPRYPGSYGKGTTGMPWEVVNPLLVLSTAGLNGAEDRHTTSRFGPGVSVSAYGADIRVADSPDAVSEVMPATTPPTYIYAKNANNGLEKPEKQSSSNCTIGMEQ